MRINELVVKILRENNIMISAMESCTGGSILNFITNIEGASEVTNGGFITYSNEQKIRMGVPESTIQKYGVYSKECAKQMANAVFNNIVTDIAIGVTGTFNNTDTNNVGEVFYCISFKDLLNGLNHLSIENQINLPQKERVLQKEIIVESIFIDLYSILIEMQN